VWLTRNWRHYLLTYLLTHSLTHSLHGAGYYMKSWLSLSLSKNILLSYGTRRFITVFTQARHWTLSWASWNQLKRLITVNINIYHSKGESIFNNCYILEIIQYIACPSRTLKPEYACQGVTYMSSSIITPGNLKPFLCDYSDIGVHKSYWHPRSPH
jgi:hypothetical protein